jgi:hypothetical protein
LLLRASPQASPSRPGSARPSTPRRFNDASEMVSAGGGDVRNNAFVTGAWLQRVDGRDKPGHDVFRSASLSPAKLTHKRHTLTCFT